jgi:error-prone DNA polymerase
VLGITAVNPVEQNLLFERFVSEERREPPDIDVDFEHERREEVIQWIYNNLLAAPARALTAVVSCYRARGARAIEVGKALASQDVTVAAGPGVGLGSDGVSERELRRPQPQPRRPPPAAHPRPRRELIGTPRHLSQHPGGFVLTQDRLDDLVPIEPAAWRTGRSSNGTRTISTR